jgi:hypothetical protein
VLRNASDNGWYANGNGWQCAPTFAVHVESCWRDQLAGWQAAFKQGFPPTVTGWT